MLVRTRIISVVFGDVFVFSVLRSEVAIRFVYIHRIVDNHCLKFPPPIIVVEFDGGNSLSVEV